MVMNIDKAPHYHVVDTYYAKGETVAWARSKDRAYHMAHTNKGRGNSKLVVHTCFDQNCYVLKQR